MNIEPVRNQPRNTVINFSFELEADQNMNTIVLGVIGADCHAVGNKILDYAFSKAGFNVVNIGVLSSQEEFINAAEETGAKAIIVSSLYGHGEIDCRGLRDKCDEAGLNDVLLYVGGNLVVGKHDWPEVRDKFTAMGFNRVYPPGADPEQGIRDLRDDLKLPKPE
jgi:methylaspartate mutase sigma subunit